MLSIQPKPVFVNKILTKPLGIGVREYAEIGIKRGLGAFFRDKSTFIHFYSLFQFSKNSLYRPLPDQLVVWKHHITEIVYAVVAFEYLYFVWVEIKLKFCFKKVLYFYNELLKVFSVSGYDDKIVGVSGIMLDLQLIFHKLIKLVHINIGEKLRGEVANRKSFLVEQVGITTRKTAYNFFRQPQSIQVLNFLSQNFRKNEVVYGIKKLFHIAFQNIAGLSVVSRHLSYYLLCREHSFMIAFTDPTRKGMGYESGFKNGIEDVVNSVVQNSVSYYRFVDMSFLRVVDVKIGIWPVLISLAHQVSLKLKNVWLQFILKLQNVRLFAFANLKLLPRQKQVFQVAYFIK